MDAGIDGWAGDDRQVVWLMAMRGGEARGQVGARDYACGIDAERPLQ